MSDDFKEFEAGHCFVSWKALQLVLSQGNFLKSVSLKFPEGDYKSNIYNGTALLRFLNTSL